MYPLNCDFRLHLSYMYFDDGDYNNNNNNNNNNNKAF